MRHKIILLAVAMLLLGACSSDDSYTAYSRYKASFTYDRVMTTTPLKNALTGPGEFCTITLTTQKRLVFQSLTLSQEVDVTASAVYQRFTCLGGFIVGMANVPEMNADWLGLVCFDLVCSNCHHDDAINRNLTLQEGGFAYCSRCKRKYNLNGQGIVVDGETGRPLERYHITYDQMNRMVISN